MTRAVRVAGAVALTLAVMPACSAAFAHTPAGPVPKPNSQFQEQVLVFLSGDITRPVNLSVLQGIREALNRKGGESIQIHTETFLQSPGYEAQMRAISKERYANIPIRAIITVNAMVSAASAVRQEFWPDIPMVYLSSGISPPASAPNSAVVNRELDTKGTLVVAHQLFPEAKRLVVAGGASPADHLRCELIIRMSKEAVPQWEIVNLSGLTAAQMKDRIKSTPPDSVIMLTGMSMDGAMQQVTSPQLVNLFSPVARAPMFDVIDSAFSLGIVGGALAQNREAGNELGNLLLRVLSGEDTRNISPVWLHSRVLLDWRQLRRFGIRESQIPAEAEVRFRDPNPWRTYGPWILGGFAAVLLQGLLIVVLLAERRSRLASEMKLSERLRYEQIVAAISAGFAHAAPGGRSEGLDNGLRRLTEFLGTERTSLWRHNHDARDFECVRSWTKSGPEIEPLTPFHAPEVLAELRAGITVRVANAAELPETSLSRNVLIERGIKSTFGIPLQTGGRLLGALTSSTFSYYREWPESVTKGFQTLGELFANELALRDSEEALRAGEELNTAVLASLPGNRAIVDRNGIIVKVNDAWAAECSAETGALCAPPGENYVDFCRLRAKSVPILKQIAEALSELLEGKTDQISTEINLDARDGQRWLEIRIQPLVGGQRGAVVAQMDVTSRKRVEIQHAHNLEFISHLNRVGALNELASSLAHEINQPLAAIGANAEAALIMVDQVSANTPELKETVNDIVSDNLRAGEVIRHMRDLLKRGQRLPTRTDVNEAALKVLPLVRNEGLLRKIELRVELGQDVPAVMTDPVQLQQVILNLVVNGMDAMSCVPESERVLTLRSHIRGGHVEMEVEDCGGGIPTELLHTIFDSFYTTKPNGLGIGLSICRSLVEADGGWIWAENGARGAIFRFALPVAPAQR